MSDPAPPSDIPDDTALQTTTILAEVASGTLQVACALAAAGRRVDLAGLDRDIGVVCAHALDLAPPHGRVIRSRLVGLLADLDSLYATMACR